MLHDPDKKLNVMRVLLKVSIDANGDMYTPAGIAKMVFKDLSVHYRVQSVESCNDGFAISAGYGGGSAGYGGGRDPMETIKPLVPEASGYVPAAQIFPPDFITPEFLEAIGFTSIDNNAWEYRIASYILQLLPLLPHNNCWHFVVRHHIVDGVADRVHSSPITRFIQVLECLAHVFDSGVEYGREGLQGSLQRLLGIKSNIVDNEEDGDEYDDKDNDEDEDDCD